MQNIKVLASGLVIAVLLLALAASGARVAGDSTSEAPESNRDATLTEVLQDTLGDSTTADDATEASESTESSGDSDGDNEGDVSASVDVDSDTSIDMDFHSSTDISVEGEGEASVDTESNQANVTVGGETIQCNPGDDYVSPDRSVSCENDGEDVDLRVRKRNEDSNFRWNIDLDL